MITTHKLRVTLAANHTLPHYELPLMTSGLPDLESPVHCVAVSPHSLKPTIFPRQSNTLRVLYHTAVYLPENYLPFTPANQTFSFMIGKLIVVASVAFLAFHFTDLVKSTP